MQPYQTTVLRNSFQLAMHHRCAEVMRKINPELICPGHRDELPCAKQDLDAYCDFISRKDRAFRQLVDEPADHYIDLFWARLLPYVSVVTAQQQVTYRLLLRNNFDRSVSYSARLSAPTGWRTTSEFCVLELAPGERGEIEMEAVAPDKADGVRRLMTAEIQLDGVSQGQVSEGLVTVVP